MTVQISNLRYAGLDKKVILMTVRGWQNYSEITFGYNPDDQAPLTLEVRELLKTNDYAIGPYVPPEPLPPPPRPAGSNSIADRFSAIEARLAALEKKNGS